MRGPDAEGSHDLGSGIYLRWVQWSPDRDLNPQYADIPDEDPTGIIVGHVHSDGEVCEGMVTFDTETNRKLNENANHPRPLWTVHSLDPLHIEPSVHMSPDKGGCGLHGFIRDEKWVGA